jgi:hypothetical protein
MHKELDRSLSLSYQALAKGDSKALLSLLPFIQAFGDHRFQSEAAAISAALRSDWNTCKDALFPLLAKGEASEASVALLLKALGQTGEVDRTRHLVDAILRQSQASFALLLEMAEALLTVGAVGDFNVIRERIISQSLINSRGTVDRLLDWALRTQNKEHFYFAFEMLSDAEKSQREYLLKRFQIEAEAGSGSIAEQILRDLLTRDPKDYLANSFLIRLLCDLNRHGEALSLLNRYKLSDIKDDPFMLESYFGILLNTEQYPRAIENAQSMLDAVDPRVKYIAGRSLAEANYKLGDHETCLSLREPLENIGKKLGVENDLFWATVASHGVRSELAERLFKKATSKKSPSALYEYSLHLLKTERYADAWPLYANRFSVLKSLKKYARYDDLPTISEDNLRLIKKIRVFPEQGLGDQLIFLRYVPRILDLGFQIALHLEERMMRVLSLCPALDGVEKIELIPPQMDQITSNPDEVVIPVGDLPLLLTRFGQPSDLPHPLLIDAGRLDEQIPLTRNRARQEATQLNKEFRRIGLAWRGASNMNATLKAIPLRLFKEMIEGLRDYRFVNCNYLIETGKDVNECGLAHRFVEPTPPQESDLVDALESLTGCDLIVSTSQTYVHFAMMLGKPILLLIPNSSAELWYWSGMQKTKNDGSISIFRFNLLRDGIPTTQIKEWIKKPAH